MSSIDKTSEDRLLGPLKQKHASELEDAASKQRLKAANRNAAVQFDIQEAMGSGDLRAAQQLRQQLQKADAVDRATLQALRAEHVRQADSHMRTEREKWASFTADRGPGGYAGDGVMRDKMVLPASLAKNGMGPSEGQMVENARERARFQGREWTPKDRLLVGEAAGNTRMFNDARLEIEGQQDAAEREREQADRLRLQSSGQIASATMRERARVDLARNPAPRISLGGTIQGRGRTIRYPAGGGPGFDLPDAAPVRPLWESAKAGSTTPSFDSHTIDRRYRPKLVPGGSGSGGHPSFL